MSRHRSWWTPDRVALVLLLASAALVAVEAEARVGGGQTFGSGRSSGGGGSYGGGGGGGGDVLYLLLHLVLRYPAVGVPLTVLFLAFLFLSQRGQTRGRVRPVVFESHTHQAPRRRYGGGAAQSGWTRLSAEDPGLSEPVFQDLVQLVFRRAYEAVGTGAWDPLAPYVDPAVQQRLTAAHQGVTGVHGVVVASSPVVHVRRSGAYDLVEVAFTSSRTEATSGGERHVYAEERWVFRRRVGARSLPPEPAMRLGCPSCGAAVQTDAMGRCAHCGTPITEGQLQWQAIEARLTVKRPISPPEVGFFSGGEEPSYRFSSVVDPQLPAQLRAFSGRHPDFDGAAFEQRLHHVFLSTQEAWSALRWQDARPYCTDAAWNQLRFWMERYERAGLRNRLADIRILRMQVVKVSLDAWYEAVTVRFWGAMKDWTEDESGRVVGGNARVDRYFSEYWTFLRAIGSGGASGDPASCPSCGAPLDRINAAGVCGYCDSVITTGRYDWVLSRIDQAEVYRG